MGRCNPVWRLANAKKTRTAPQQTSGTADMPLPAKTAVITEAPHGRDPAKGKAPIDEEIERPVLQSDGLGLNLGCNPHKQKLAGDTEFPSRPTDPTRRLAQQPAQSKENEKAQIEFSPEGYYEVQIDHEHGLKIAQQCGVRAEDVFQALADDNEERRRVATDCPNPLTDEELREINDRFEPDPADELGSEEE